jgi:uncharacterized membrane protein
MPSIVMMLFAGILNGVGDFFTKLAAGKISPYISAITLSLSAVFTVAIYFIFVKNVPGNLVVSKAGLLYSALGGISIGLGMIFFFNLFAKGANISTAQPIIKSIVVLSAVLLGVIVLKEKMNFAQVIGMVFSIIGIYFLAK